MPTPATLGIAIPTFQRGSMLRECLQSLIPQALGADGRVMVWICDNSEDDLAEQTICDLLERHPWIHYERNPSNLGAALNVLKVMERTLADFVWMMGDDDVIMPGAIARVLREIDDRPGLNGILLNQCYYDLEMQTLLRAQNTDLSRRMGCHDRFFTDGGEMVKRAGFHIGVVSVLVVRRLGWEAIIAADPAASYFQSAYVMSFVYGKEAVQYGHWSYLDTVAVGCRTGNDSWWGDRRYVERLELVVVAGKALFTELFPDDRAAPTGLNRHTCRHFVGANIRGVIGFGSAPGFRISAGRLCWQYYKSFPEFYGFILPSLLMPRWMLLAIRRLRRGRVPTPRWAATAQPAPSDQQT